MAPTPLSQLSQAELDVDVAFGKQLASMQPELQRLQRAYYKCESSFSARFSRRSRSVARREHVDVKPAFDAYIKYQQQYRDLVREKKNAARLVRKLKMPSDTPMMLCEWDIPRLFDVLVKTDYTVCRPHLAWKFSPLTFEIIKPILAKVSKAELVENLLWFRCNLIQSSEHTSDGPRRLDDLFKVSLFDRASDGWHGRYVTSGTVDGVDVKTIKTWAQLLAIAKVKMIRELSKNDIIDAIINFKIRAINLLDDVQVCTMFQEPVQVCTMFQEPVPEN
jgi:hypothetical protein